MRINGRFADIRYRSNSKTSFKRRYRIWGVLQSLFSLSFTRPANEINNGGNVVEFRRYRHTNETLTYAVIIHELLFNSSLIQYIQGVS